MTLVLLVSGKLIKLTKENKIYIYGQDVFFDYAGELTFGSESKYGMTEVKRRLTAEDMELLKKEYVRKQSLVVQINFFKLTLKELNQLLIVTSAR